MTEKIEAPWTDEQVRFLNWSQIWGGFHPFKCGNNGKSGYHTEESRLVATPNGWICPLCDWQQKWAHSFMAQKPQPPTDEAVAAAKAANSALGE